MRHRAQENAGQLGPPRFFGRDAAWGWALFVFLLAVYQINGDILPGNDAKPNTYLSLSLLGHGNLSFTPRETPFMFTWHLQTPAGRQTISFNTWADTFRGQSASQLYDSGVLTFHEPRYFLVPTAREGIYVSTFGPGPGLFALPVMAVLDIITGDLAAHPKALWYGAKFAAALAVAASAVFVFLTALAFTSRWKALIVALAYGLGTCVWSTSSQALWQHGPNEFFLALGTFFLTRVGRGRRYAAFCALAYACAVVCRPTSAVVVVAVAAYLAIADRKSLLMYVLAGLPIAVLLGWHNAHYFGSPFRFGQFLVASQIAQSKTGIPYLWQTPLWEGAAGLLVSPSRGLLVYSPFMALALWGIWATWRNRTFAPLRPLTVALAVLLCVAFKWYDWWGGWSFGYRQIVDTTPILAVLLVPAVDRLWRHKVLLGAFGALLAWSMFVQVIGAFAYDPASWNAKRQYEVSVPGRSQPVVVSGDAEARHLARIPGARLLNVRNMDVDLPAYRYRLWTLADSQVLYCLSNFGESRALKRETVAHWIQTPSD